MWVSTGVHFRAALKHFLYPRLFASHSLRVSLRYLFFFPICAASCGSGCVLLGSPGPEKASERARRAKSQVCVHPRGEFSWSLT